MWKNTSLSRVQKHYQKWLLYLILLKFLQVTSQLKYNSEPSDFDCTSDVDCKSAALSRSSQCGICVESIKKKYQCLYPFSYMFKSNDKNCTKADPCPLECKNGGYCFQKSEKLLVYGPQCKCQGLYYGDECQFLAKESETPIQNVNWIFQGLIPVGQMTIIRVVVHSKWSPIYDQYGFYITTKEGYTGYQAGTNKIERGCYYKSLSCTGLKIPITFPYKMYGQTNKTEFLTINDEIVGYFSSLTIVLVDEVNKAVYNRSFPIVVDYRVDNLKCVPLVKLRNCVSDLSTPTTYTRASSIHLVGKATYVADGMYVSKSVMDESCATSVNFIWKMWNFISAQETDEPIFQNYTKNSWLFEPYSLAVGTYKVMLEVQNVQIQNISTNTDCCYFKLKYLPLIAVVDGGNDRMVFKEMGIKLSAARSRDPNMPRSQQSELYVQWSCKRIQPPSNDDPMCVPKTTEYNKPYFIKPDRLTYSAVYNFTLLLFSTRYKHCEDDLCVKPEYAYVRIEVGNKTINSSVSIQCLKNCVGKVVASQQLFLKVKSDNYNVSESTEFEWTFHKVLEEDEKSMDHMKVERLPSFMLLVKEDSFEIETEYTISVRVYPQGGYAKYSFITDKEEEGNCTVNPEAGVKGFTLFDIVCSLSQDSTLLYEFYDKSADDLNSTVMLSGRMLGSSSTGDLYGVQLTKGVVTVYVINVRGFHFKRQIIVSLVNWNMSEDMMAEVKKNLSDSLSVFRDEQNALRIMSLIPNIMPPESNKQEILEYLCRSMNGISTDTLSMVKLTILTLYNVLTDLNTNFELELEVVVRTETLGTIKKQAESLKRFLSNKEKSLFLPPTEIKQVVQLILHCVHKTLRSKSNKTVVVELDDLTLRELLAFDMESNYLEDILDSVKDTLSFVQVPGMPPIKLSSEEDHVVVWVLSNDKDYPITNYLKRGTPVHVSPQLLNSIDDKRFNLDMINLQIATVSDNLFWWLKSDIKSDLVSVSIALRKEQEDDNRINLRHVNVLRYPLEINLNIKEDVSNITVTDFVKQLESQINVDQLDLNIKVHRFDITPRSLMSIMFRYPPTNGSLRVCLMEDYRPDFKKMQEDSTVISELSPMYPHRYHEYDEPRFLYLGILPGPDIPANQTVEYTFQINTKLCQFWNRGSWSSEGCLIGPGTQGKEVVCQCTHLSIFAAAFPVPPQQIDPFVDAKLFLTVLDNPLVVSLVVAMLIIYLVLFICLLFKDKKDSIKRSVVVLEDNYPLDKYPYLLAVFTSPRFNAGTTAHVGIKLFGSATNSRSNVLTSSHRKVLKTGCDDWFLIYTPEHLGELTGIHIWHDNAGRSPSWFCTRIFVYDLKEKTETKFRVDQWLALQYMERRRNKCYPEAFLIPIKEEDISDLKRGFLENVVLGIRDSHMILSVFYCHPRSEISRSHRLSIIMVYIMVAMLCSIMFYKPTEGEMGVDDHQYSVATREVIISIQSLIISVILTVVVLFAFKRSYKWKYSRRESSTQISAPTFNHKSEKVSAYSTFVRFVITTFKHPPLSPVQLHYSEPVVERRNVWYVISWIVCFSVIFLSAYFVMLYGLKLGLVKSQKWLTSVVLALGEDTLVAGPARILLFAVLLSLAFQLMIEVNTYYINLQDTKVETSSWGIEYMEQLLYTRSKPFYMPINDVLRYKMIKKDRLNSDWWSLLDFIAAAGFVFVTCNVIFRLWTSHFYMNKHVQTMLAETQVELLDSIQFYQIKNISCFENYISNNFLHIIYDTRWYNEYMFERDEAKYWAVDFTNRLVGRPKIRQLRVRPVSCSSSVLKNKICAPKWKVEHEDTDPYAKGWKPVSHLDVSKENSPWLYTDTTSILTPLVRLYGSSGRLFHNGGYSVTLGPTRQDVDQVLKGLKGNRWQDRYTRVVFVELTMFNPNYGLFSQVTLVVEYMASGKVLLKAQAISVSNSFELNLWDILFVVCIFFYILRSAYLLNFLGLLEYLYGGFNNICRLVVVYFGLLSILLFFFHFYTTSLFAAHFQASRVDHYFDFDSFTHYFVLLQIMLSFLLVIAILRLIMSIRGGKYFHMHFYTFKMSLGLIFWVVLVLLVMCFVLKQFTYLLNIFTSYGMKEVMINHNSMKYLMNEDFKNTHIRIFLTLKMICSYLFNSTFIVLFVKCTKLSKSHRFSASERFNFITFLISKITGKGYEVRRSD